MSVRPAVRLSVRLSVLHFFSGETGRGVMKGCGGFKTNLNKKVRGSRQIIIIFFYNLHPDYFFSNGRVRQEGGMIQAN